MFALLDDNSADVPLMDNLFCLFQQFIPLKLERLPQGSFLHDGFPQMTE
jgi:hypothetical protein